MGSCNTLNDLSNKVCGPSKTEDLNLRVFNMITGINESKILTKHVSCKCKCKFDSRKCNLNQNWNNNQCWCKCKNPPKHCGCGKDYIWNPGICSCENGKYLASVIDDLVIMYDEIMKKTKTIPIKTVPTNFSEKNSLENKKNLYFTHFLLITIALLIAAIIYCYLIKYRAKQKHLLPYQVTDNNLEDVLY